MSRRYDSQTTTFSPEGRLHQVEYALASIQNAAPALAITTPFGIVLAAEEKVTSKLLAPSKSSEKMYTLDDHVLAAVAGLTSDANILVNTARLAAQRYRYTYDEDQPVQQLAQLVADYKHGYTQHGSLRPFGCSFLFTGWDKHYGYQIFQSDPAGNFSGWKATAIGANSTSAISSLRSEYKDGMSLEEAKLLAVKVLVKALDTTHPSADRLEIATLTRNDETGVITQAFLSKADIQALIDASEAAAAASTSGTGAAPPAAAAGAPMAQASI